MTHAQWTQTIQAKVNSSWNLHRLLPRKMDFFILISSLSGIYGLPSQSNYAAGNTFLDSLARMRSAQGRYGTSVALDLGYMQTIGIVAENPDQRRLRESVRDMEPIQTKDFLAMLEHYCDPDLPSLGPDESQILIGLTTPADYRARGQEPLARVRSPLFAPFDVVRPHCLNANTRSSHNHEDVAQLFKQAPDTKARTTVVINAFKNKLSHALGVLAEDIDPGRSLSDYGVDSLMAVELRNMVWRDFGANVAVFEILGERDILGAAGLVVKKAAE